MILKTLLALIILLNQGLLRDQHKKLGDKYVEETIGFGKLREIETTSDHEYYIFESENENNGVMVVFATVKGRFDFFDYMVILSPAKGIMDIKILKYRSEYGYEIATKGWLKQFYKKPEIRFEYKKNIDALSGATFSARSLVTDINHVLDHLPVISP